MIELVITSALLGVGLAMDAFSVSLANGLAEPDMNTARTLTIAGTYAGFQIMMPLAGWYLVTRVADMFEAFRPFIPWIALILLLMIGVGLLKDGLKEGRQGSDSAAVPDGDEVTAGRAQLTAAALFMQGVATSIDALSVGFTTADYSAGQALISSFIIGAVTLLICICGLRIGRRLGTLLAGKASILGGIILIAIGLEIWIKGIFF